MFLVHNLLLCFCMFIPEFKKLNKLNHFYVIMLSFILKDIGLNDLAVNIKYVQFTKKKILES